jgi:CBS domain-containing protein
VMRTPPVSVLPDLKVSEFIDRILTKHRQTGFPVARDGRLHGMLLLQRLREVPKEKWEQVIVRDVMEPIDESHFVTVRASIDHATRKLKSNQIGQLAVIDGEGILVGYLCETDLSVSV